MKNKKLLLNVILLVVILILATFAYNKLKKDNNLSNNTPIINEESTNESTEKRELAPDFIVFDKDGKQVKLSDFRGQITVINFWASWCGYCILEMPDFEKVYHSYKDKNINFMMINVTDGNRETKEKADEVFKSNNFTMPIYYDHALTKKDGLSQNDSALYAYEVSAFPTTVFVNEKGELVAEHPGYMEETDLIKYIEFLLNNK